MSRNRLAMASLPAFLAYCESKGWRQEKPKDVFEVARLAGHGKRVIIHRRIANSAGTELVHLTLHGHGEHLFSQWKRDRVQEHRVCDADGYHCTPEAAALVARYNA